MNFMHLLNEFYFLPCYLLILPYKINITNKIKRITPILFIKYLSMIPIYDSSSLIVITVVINNKINVLMFILKFNIL